MTGGGTYPACLHVFRLAEAPWSRNNSRHGVIFFVAHELSGGSARCAFRDMSRSEAVGGLLTIGKLLRSSHQVCNRTKEPALQAGWFQKPLFKVCCPLQYMYILCSPGHMCPIGGLSQKRAVGATHPPLTLPNEHTTIMNRRAPPRTAPRANAARLMAHLAIVAKRRRRRFR